MPAAWCPWGFWRSSGCPAPPPPPRRACSCAPATPRPLAGHPETAAHTALLSMLYLAVRGAARQGAAFLGWAAGWLGGAALAAVQLLPLALLLPATARWQGPAGGRRA